MKLAAIAITTRGIKLCSQLKQEFAELDIYITEKQAANYGENSAEVEITNYQVLKSSLRDNMEDLMKEYEGIICFMALGIVVRIISPWLEDKREDPAVVTVDESGSYAISTLSGHLGGANNLTKRVASLLRAQPVITTATDVSNKPALDLLAAELNCIMIPFNNLKRASAALVNDNKLNIFCKNEEYKNALMQTTKSGNIPGEFQDENIEFIFPAGPNINFKKLNSRDGFSLFFTNQQIFGDELTACNQEQVLQMIPRNIIIGIGARRNIKAQKIKAAVDSVKQELNLQDESIKSLATVDIKQQEPGLKRAAEEMNLPLKIVSQEEISQEMESSDFEYSFSAFVKDKIGVGGVCEPAAMLKAKKGKMLQSKKKRQGVTTAVVEESFILSE